MFNKLKTNNQAMNETNQDRLGGGYSPLKSGIYKSTIAYAYGTTSKSGAMGVVIKFNIHQEGQDKPRPFTQTFWVSNKEGNTFYTDKEGNPHNLAGFNQVNQLCALVTGKGLLEVPMEERQLPLYNSDAKKEVLTSVPCIVDLLNAEIALGMHEIRANKQEKNSLGEYVDMAEERIYNEVDKFFAIQNGELLTFNEVREGATTSDFAIKWAEKWNDNVVNKYKEPKSSKPLGATTKPLSIG